MDAESRSRSADGPFTAPRLEAYVKGVVGAFANDDRVLAWDVWNEPDNPNRSSYGKLEPPDKVAMVNELLPKTFEWARSAKPKQPITCGVWKGDWSARGQADCDRQDPTGDVRCYLVPQL